MVVVPLIASTLIMAIVGLPRRGAAGRMVLQAFGCFLASLFLALLGIGFGLAFAREDHWYTLSAFCSRFLSFQTIANIPRWHPGLHVNISGISGVATKTTYASFLLYRLFHSKVLGEDALSTKALASRGKTFSFPPGWTE